MPGRGRGKRIIPVTTIVSGTELTTNDALLPEPEKSAKKSGRKKQFPVVAVVTPDGIQGNLLPEVKKPLIVHLPIQSREISLNDLPMTYDPNPPTDAEPYDINADNPFYDDLEHVSGMETTPSTSKVIETNASNMASINTDISDVNRTNTCTTVSNSSSTNIVQNTDDNYYNMKSTLLVQYSNTNEIRTIPEVSDSACFWCCHTFTNRPVILPIRDTGEYIQVMGNFCCPECAIAYLFDIRQDSHTRWEQLALLYRIYTTTNNMRFHPAPPRTVLKLFGGNLSIEEYRNMIQSHKVRVDIHLPPMVSILATMDTKPIDFYDTNLTKTVTESIKDRLQKAEEVLRLRRTKPLKAWESTLDACINLKIKS
jgi:hypothetical protein